MGAFTLAYLCSVTFRSCLEQMTGNDPNNVQLFHRMCANHEDVRSGFSLAIPISNFTQ